MHNTVRDFSDIVCMACSVQLLFFLIIDPALPLAIYYNFYGVRWRLRVVYMWEFYHWVVFG